MERIRIKILITFVGLVVFFFVSCTDSEKEFSDVSEASNSQIDEWKMDSLGCDHIRTLEMAFEIAEQEDLLNKSYEEVCKVMGPPNEDSIKGTERTLKYYYKSACYEGEVIRGGVCWALFEFESDRLIKLPEIGFCQ